MSTKEKPDNPLKTILQQGRLPKESNLIKVSKESAKLVYSLAAQIEKITEALLQRKVEVLKDPSRSNKDWQEAIATINALTDKEEGVELRDWESPLNFSTLSKLREEIVNLVLLRNRRALESADKKRLEEIITALTPFRKGSKTLEARLCARDNLSLGPLKTRKLNPSQVKEGNIPDQIEEILYCLAQFKISSIKESRPKLNKEQAQTVQFWIEALSKPNAKKPSPKANTSFFKVGRNQFLEKIRTSFHNIATTQEEKQIIENEESIYTKTTEDIGTELETLHSLEQSDLETIKHLEEIYDTLINYPLKDSPKDDLPEETKIRVIHTLKKINPSLSKATTIALASKIFENKNLIKTFKEKGEQAISESQEYKDHISLTEPDDLEEEISEELKSELDKEGEIIRETISLLEEAENIIYTKPIYYRLNTLDRERIYRAAQIAISGEVPSIFKKVEQTASETDLAETPGNYLTYKKLTQELQIIQKNAETLHQAIFQEIEGSQTSLENLPLALRNHEFYKRTEIAISQIMEIFSKPQVFGAIKELERETKAILQTLETSSQLTEQDAKTHRKATRRLKTLETFLTLCQNKDSLNDRNYKTLLDTVENKVAPKNQREQAIVTLCDNKTEDGIQIETKDVLDRLQVISKEPYLAGRVRSHIQTLREWKEKELPSLLPNRFELAKTICKCPENLKKNMEWELTLALKSVLNPPPWKNPTNISNEELNNVSTSINFCKIHYKTNSNLKNILNQLESLHSQIYQEQDPKKRLRLIADLSKDTNLRTLESRLIKHVLYASDPEPLLELTQSWLALKGNPYLLKEAIQEENIPIEKINASLLATKIQIKIENLRELSQYAKNVATDPLCLAEAYIQTQNKWKDSEREPWIERLERALDKVNKKIEEAQKEIEDWKLKFESIFEFSSDIEDEYTSDDKKKRETIKNMALHAIRRRERQMESLFLKKERVEQLIETSKSLDDIRSQEDILKALRNPPIPKYGVSMETALQQALDIAGNPEKLRLNSTPKSEQIFRKPEDIRPLEIIEAGALKKTFDHIHTILNQAAKTLGKINPTAQSIELSRSDPRQPIKELKTLLFETFKHLEAKAHQVGQSTKVSEEIKEFIENNPEIAEIRKAWAEKIKVIKETFSDAMLIAKKHIKSEEKKIKKDPIPNPA